MNRASSLCLALVLILLPSLAFAFPGKVIHIADGDTITVLTPDKRQVKVRLYGIDTPEKRQPFGRKAGDFTKSLCALQAVDVDVIDHDRYGRSVGLVTLADGRCLNTEILRAGFAWVYTKYCRKGFCDDWMGLEQDARSLRRGLWSDDNSTPPWEWRRRR